MESIHHVAPESFASSCRMRVEAATNKFGFGFANL